MCKITKLKHRNTVTVCMFGSVLSPKKVDFRQLPNVFVSDLIHLPWKKQVKLLPAMNLIIPNLVRVQLLNLVHDHCSGFSLLLFLSWLPLSLPTISLAPEGYSCCPIVTVEVGFALPADVDF